MDNSKYRSHPNICAYLWYLWNIEKLTGGEILDRTIEMQCWLDDNCWDNGERAFFWDDHYTPFPLLYNKDYNGLYNTKNNHHVVSLSNFLAFKDKEDLLALGYAGAFKTTYVIPAGIILKVISSSIYFNGVVYFPKFMAHLKEEETQVFKYSVDITDYVKALNASSVTSTRYFKIHGWLVDNIGEKNFIMGYKDLGNNKGYWALFYNNEEDIILFKLQFGKLGCM